jgi:dienelactone hydrolase
MNIVLGFLPWIVFWVLSGNVDFRTTMLITLAVSIALMVVGKLRGQRAHSLDIGSLVVFVLLTIAAFVIDDSILESWLQPLSNFGLFLVALGGIVVGRPFVRDYAAASVDDETARSDGFRYITVGMTWVWTVVFGLMTIISAIPALVDGNASSQDQGSLLSVLCYWVFPYTLLGMAGVVSALFPPWFEKRSALIDKREVDETPQVAAIAPSPADVSDGSLALSIPAESAHDAPFPLMVKGAPAGADVEVSASGPDLFGRTWGSHAVFTAAADGVVNLATAEPKSGDWASGDRAAPLWAMRFAEPDRTPDLFVPPVDGWPVTVSVSVSGGGQVQRTVSRRPAASRIGVESVDVDGLPGLLALPAGTAPAPGWPGVVCFGGSEGGFESQSAHAALLASHGYAALAACWLPGGEASSGIVSIPLERFLAPLEFLGGHPQVDATRVAALAVSRGAEGVLAASSRLSALAYCGLALVSPSSVTWQATGGEGAIPDKPSWTIAGDTVPWVPMPTGAVMPQLIRNAWTIGRDTANHRPTLLKLRPAYEAGLRQRSESEVDARIAVERVNSPLLLLTGGEDALWPSEQMAQEMLSRRAEASGDQHFCYPGAGHLIRFGNFPTDAQWTGGIALGGSREGQAEAQRDALPRLLEFLASVTASTTAKASQIT